MTLPVRLLAAATILSFAAPAVAAIAVHVETGGPHAVSFDIAKQPAPASFVLGSSFILDGVKGVFDGVAGTRSIEFFNNSLKGGFQVAGGPGIFSQQIYLHGESTPLIASGDYSAQDRASGANVGLLIYQSGTIGGVPEPVTWALMVGGFGLVGMTMRSRRRGEAVA